MPDTATGNMKAGSSMRCGPTEAQRAKLLHWARRIQRQTAQVLMQYPEADPEDVRHTLILLSEPPWERLTRGLIRGGAKTRSTH